MYAREGFFITARFVDVNRHIDGRHTISTVVIGPAGDTVKAPPTPEDANSTRMVYYPRMSISMPNLEMTPVQEQPAKWSALFWV